MARTLTARFVAMFVLAFVGTLALGCGATPLERVDSQNPEVTAALIAEFDGIRLYRVDTGDRVVYVAAQRGGVTGASWDRKQGKTTRRERVETVPAP